MASVDIDLHMFQIPWMLGVSQPVELKTRVSDIMIIVQIWRGGGDQVNRGRGGILSITEKGVTDDSNV